MNSQLQQIVATLKPHLATPISEESTSDELVQAFKDECEKREWDFTLKGVGDQWVARIIVRNQAIASTHETSAIALGSALAHAIQFDVGQNN